MASGNRDSQRRKKRNEDRRDYKEMGSVSSRHKGSKDKSDRSKHRRRERDVTDNAHAADERKKVKEDAQWRVSELAEFTDIISRPAFYSDRKGDILNVKYGRIHSGDIPKYGLLGREYIRRVCDGGFMTEIQAEEKFLGLTARSQLFTEVAKAWK